MKKHIYTFLIASFYLFSISNLVLAEEILFSKVQICKACLATVMSKDPKIIKIDKNEGDIIYLSYIRPSDKKKWAYRCKLSGSRFIWASDTGRWRDSQYDSKVTYEISGELIKITDRFNDGSASSKSFTIKQLN